jgi:uncharacterized protein
MKTYAELAFTPAVQQLQEQHGSRDAYARMHRPAEREEGLGPREAEHLAGADSFYIATVSETGWPYVQHRGGPRGFLRVLSPTLLAFADFGGNRQFVSVGNATRDDRASLIVMDYGRRRRLKLLGRLRFQSIDDADATVVSATEVPGYRARVQRVGLIEIEAFDWNCPQHITQRFTVEEVEAVARPLQERIRALEAEVAKRAERGRGR